MVSGVPPFERFYESHKGEVLAFLRRRAGRDRADDLFQETFLRALRAYGRLEHGEHLRAWVLTIATNAVVDAARRERPTAELSVEPAGEDQRPAVEELAPLTDGLPPEERAAVARRYGYDPDRAPLGAPPGPRDDVRRARRAGRLSARRTGGRHRDEPKPAADRPPLPPRGRRERQSHRLRRWARPQGVAAAAGGGAFVAGRRAALFARRLRNS